MELMFRDMEKVECWNVDWGDGTGSRYVGFQLGSSKSPDVLSSNAVSQFCIASILPEQNSNLNVFV